VCGTQEFQSDTSDTRFPPTCGIMRIAVSPDCFASFDGGFESAASGTKVSGVCDNRADGVIGWEGVELNSATG
jgi:hypothetical protein